MGFAHEGLIHGVDSTVAASATQNSTGPTTLATAPTATSIFYMTDLVITQTGSDLLSVVIAGTSGTSFSTAVAPSGGGIAKSFTKPFKFGPGTLTATQSAAATLGSVFYNIVGFWLSS